ncbi:MAG: SRPBCC family protein [Terriglobales bacterium]
MNESRERWSGQERKRLGTVEGWFSLIGGGALAGYGMKHAIGDHSKLGIALAAGGGALVFNGLRPRSHSSGVHLQAAFTINKPVSEVYRYWRDLEGLPKFMRHLESVRKLDDRHSEWTMRGPMGARFTWQSEIVDQAEDRYIVWRSMPGSIVESSSSLQFREAPGGRGTELVAAMHYGRIGNYVGKGLAEILGTVPERVLREELRRFKQLLEAGEIPTVEGQTSGRKSLLQSAKQAAGKIARMPERMGEKTAYTSAIETRRSS